VRHLSNDVESMTLMNEHQVAQRSPELALKELELTAQAEYLKSLHEYLRVEDQTTIDSAREQKAKADLAELELPRATKHGRRGR
jgi:hypothetical protein